jgi:fructuronate reductase/mannitol 2-dehydrogenase
MLPLDVLDERSATGRTRRDRHGGAACGIPLTDATLHRQQDGLSVPTYDRSALTPAVVHLSVGGFHRAHQLLYFDDVAERRISSDWGVVGVGLRSRDLKEALAPQDHLYTVVARSPDGEHARVVGVMVDYHFAPDDPTVVLDLLADERTRMVSMTITDSGYRVDPETGAFDADDVDVRHDLWEPARPRTVFGFLCEALDRRRRAGLPGFTVVSCDNMRRNGDVARSALVGFARLRDEDLARWIDAHVTFPSSMVDRITPHTTPEQRVAVAQRYGVDDRWPVITEPFSQWVIQDRFCNGRPPLDQVGVRFVADVDGHELVKTRLLNAAHSAVGYLGTLAGHRSIDRFMSEPLLAEYVTRLMDDEIAPQLTAPEGVDLDRYKRTLLQRFANPAIADQLTRLCRRGSTKLPHHLIPTLREARAAGRPHALLTLAVAAWFLHLRGIGPLPGRVEVEDPRADLLQALARRGGSDPRPLLGERSIFGDLADDEGFATDVATAMARLEQTGVRATLRGLLPRSVREVR